ncbi:9866_t:CDS:10 [Diversispora eburnea]|uniref:9866_t:CDS:1 n=1 Tax=Diversispora eburnea TaxID=1213867 RepID=A0A9N8YM43_9GLOM|nr:9866_t:CDS:10 [Diversispora eburnea]
MPLYARKQIHLVPKPKLNLSKNANHQVWVISYTSEIFLSYQDYLKRIALYEKRIWQCVVTGKQGLTYHEALESEKTHRETLENKFPLGLIPPVLEKIQFNTERLDVVVNEIFEKYKDLYSVGEVIFAMIDRKKVKVKVSEVKLITPKESSSKGAKRKSIQSQIFYEVQMLDDDGNPLRQKNKKFITKTINGSYAVCRADKLSFTKTLIRKFVKESATKDTYFHAPWVVKSKLAKMYKISTQLPEDLQKSKDYALKKSRKRKTNKKLTASEKARQEKKKRQDIENKKKEAEKNRKQKEKEENQKRRKAEQKKIKYPIEDLGVPLDRSLLQKRPSLVYDFKVPQDCVGIMLSIWNFFTIFGKTLGMSFCTLDDFESSLYHTVTNPRCYLTIEMHVSLLNAIIKDRMHSKGKKRVINHAVSNDAMEIDNNDEIAMLNTSREILEMLGNNWDRKLISSSDGRKGWETILAGCIYQLMEFSSTPNLEHILAKIVPRRKSNIEETLEKNYVILEAADKLQILEFLINTVSKSQTIHDHIERCSEKLSELNKEKLNLAKEKRQLLYSLSEIDKDKLIENLLNEGDSSATKPDENFVIRKRKLEENEIMISKKEEQIEKDKRKYAIPRVPLLGKDRFYNKYYYFDNIGAAVSEKYGTGRIFVESANEFDLEIMTEKEEQRFKKRRKIEEFGIGRNASNVSVDNQTQWGYYDDIAQVKELQGWLNSKGVRELSFQNELNARLPDISAGITKRQQDFVTTHTTQEVRRSKRTQTTLAMLSAQSYMKWSNKLAK